MSGSVHPWSEVLARVRENNRRLAGNRLLRDRNAVVPFLDLRPVWRAKAYREAVGMPEPVVRARAFAHVLENDALYLYPGDRLLGSHMGWFWERPPDGLTLVEIAHLTEEEKQRGRRTFWAGWDHTLADYPTLLEKGIGGLIAEVRRSRQQKVADGDRKGVEALDGMQIALEGFSAYIRRWGDRADAAGLREEAAVAYRVASAPPSTFREAVQLVAFTHLAFESENRAHMALGRVDQYLFPFYERDMRADRLSRDEALEWLCRLWIKLAENQGVQNICIGGLTPEGGDGTNELSYLCLEATGLVQSPHTNLSARFHDGTPERFYEACFDLIRTGIGFPAVFNDHVLIPGLVEIGIPEPVARDYCMVGCIETMLAGRQQAWSDGRFNMPLYLEQAIRALRGQSHPTYDGLIEDFLDRMRHGLDDYTARYEHHMREYPPDRFPDPFLSALTQDCIARGRNINDGGARFKRFHGIAVMGLATTADSLAAMKKLVFEERRVPLNTLLEALETDFVNAEPLRRLLEYGAPKYGNDDPYVDDIAAFLVDWTSREILRREIEGGGRYVAAMAANVSNIPAGQEVGATPDGRHAKTPLSDAASPYFGRDEKGPTAFLNSVSRPDYHRVLSGSVINMKFEPEFFEGPEGPRIFTTLLKAFVAKRIPELQFNFTGNRVLLDAQQNPERYRNLIVRVSGFSEYFVHLSPEVQNDVIRRRAHAGW
jgi:formate C-acetyltransferase